MDNSTDPVADPDWPDITAFDPNDPDLAPDLSIVDGYETDLAAVGTARTASPPDGKDQDWREIHPTPHDGEPQ